MGAGAAQSRPWRPGGLSRETRWIQERNHRRFTSFVVPSDIVGAEHRTYLSAQEPQSNSPNPCPMSVILSECLYQRNRMCDRSNRSNDRFAFSHVVYTKHKCKRDWPARQSFVSSLGYPQCSTTLYCTSWATCGPAHGPTSETEQQVVRCNHVSRQVNLVERFISRMGRCTSERESKSSDLALCF